MTDSCQLHSIVRRGRKKLKSNAIFSNCKENIISDFSIGCNVLSKAKWFELLEAERSKDEEHNNFLDSLYKGYVINLRELSRYKIFNKETIDKDDYYEKILWAIAPIIVKTNRERIILNYIRAIQFARSTNTFLVRWRANITKWEGKTTEDQLDEVN